MSIVRCQLSGVIMAIAIAISVVVDPSPARANDLKDFFKNPIKEVGGFVKDNQALVGLGLYWLVSQQSRGDNRRVAKATVETRRAETAWYAAQIDQVKRQVAQTDQLFEQTLSANHQPPTTNHQQSVEPEIIRPIDNSSQQQTAASRLAFVGHRLNLSADDQFAGWRAIDSVKDRLADFDYIVIAIDGLPREAIVNIFADGKFLLRKEAKASVSQEELAMRLAIAMSDLPPATKEIRLEALVFWPDGAVEEAEFFLFADPPPRQAEKIPGLAALPSLTRQTFAKNDDGRRELAASFRVQKNETKLAWRQQ